MNRSFVASLVIATAVTVAAGAQTSATSQTAASATQNTSATTGKAGANTASTTGATASQTTKAASQGVAANTAASAANQTSGALQVPEGTRIPAVLSKSIDSKKAKVGDKVEAKTVADIVSQGKVVIPRNSKLLGHITESQAKASGGAESRLGIVFDQLVMKKGQTMPFRANIQAIGAAVVRGEETGGPAIVDNTGPMGGESVGSAGGGLVGGVGSTVGGATGTIGGVAGGVTNTGGSTAGAVGSTVGAATQGTVGAAGNTVGLHGTLNSNSSGVVGLKDLQLASNTNSSAGASVVTSSGKSVKLNSGSQLMLNVSGSSAPQQ